MATTYLIDVFNLLHCYPPTRSLMDENKLLEAEILFLNEILNFTQNNPAKCFLFFDGMNKELAEKWNYPNIKIIFCHPQSADDRMKAHIKNIYGQRALKNKTVTVSDDRNIISFSKRYDIEIMKSNQFLELLHETITHPRMKIASREKPETPTSAEIEEYLNLLAEDDLKKQDNENE